jgi:hypothetical protein
MARTVQVLQHLGDLESFCTRVQVVLQQEERQKIEALTAKRRATSDGGGEGEEDEGGDKDAGEAGGDVIDAGREVRTSAAIKSSKVAANAPVKAVPAPPAISLPDIRDDDDAYFGDAADVPMELSALRLQVKHMRPRRHDAAHVVQVLSP